jgi:hypothetical protein
MTALKNSKMCGKKKAGNSRREVYMASALSFCDNRYLVTCRLLHETQLKTTTQNKKKTP